MLVVVVLVVLDVVVVLVGMEVIVEVDVVEVLEVLELGGLAVLVASFALGWTVALSLRFGCAARWTALAEVSFAAGVGLVVQFTVGIGVLFPVDPAGLAEVEPVQLVSAGAEVDDALCGSEAMVVVDAVVEDVPGVVGVAVVDCIGFIVVVVVVLGLLVVEVGVVEVGVVDVVGLPVVLVGRLLEVGRPMLETF